MKELYPLLAACDPTTCTGNKIMFIERIIGSIYRRHLSHHGVTNSQLSALFIISKMPGLSQSDLGRILFLEKSSVSRNVQHLIKAQWVTIENRILVITDLGLQKLEELIPSWERAKSEVAEHLQPSGQAALETLFQQLAK